MTQPTLSPNEIQQLLNRAKRLADETYDRDPALSLLIAESAARIEHEGATPDQIKLLVTCLERALEVLR